MSCALKQTSNTCPFQLLSFALSLAGPRRAGSADAESCSQHYLVRLTHVCAVLVRRMSLFDQLDPDCLGKLAECLRLTVVDKGKMVFQQGDDADGMFFIGAIKNRELPCALTSSML